MSMRYESSVAVHGNVGQLVVIADLVPLGETARANGVESVGVHLRRGESGLNFPIPITGTEQFISYEDVVRASEGADPDESTLSVQWRFDFDRSGSSAHLQPSDLVDEMGRMGISEERIQATLEWERSSRG
jgi:hypothetical protein